MESVWREITVDPRSGSASQLCRSVLTICALTDQDIAAVSAYAESADAGLGRDATLMFPAKGCHRFVVDNHHFVVQTNISL
jgi:hypothetical protein